MEKRNVNGSWRDKGRRVSRIKPQVGGARTQPAFYRESRRDARFGKSIFLPRINLDSFSIKLALREGGTEALPSGALTTFFTLQTSQGRRKGTLSTNLDGRSKGKGDQARHEVTLYTGYVRNKCSGIHSIRQGEEKIYDHISEFPFKVMMIVLHARSKWNKLPKLDDLLHLLLQQQIHYFAAAVSQSPGDPSTF